MPVASQVVGRVAADIQPLKKGYAEAKQETSNLASHMKSVLGGIFSTAGGILAAGGITAVVGGLKSLVLGGIEANASMEQTQTAFAGLLHSSKAAADEIEKLKKFAADTPFEFPELADSTQKLLAFGFKLDDTQGLITAIGDALSGLGKATPAYLEQVVDVFGQMNAAGKIQTQDLKQLTSVGINGFQVLADNIKLTKDQAQQLEKDGFGKIRPGAKLTSDEIQDLVTKGLIPSKQGIDALQTGLKNTFGGQMQQQSKTFNGLMSTFKDNIGQALQTATGPLFDKAKQGLQTLGDIVSSQGFKDFAGAVGKGISDTLDHIGQFLGTLKDNFLKAFNDPNGDKVRKLKDLAKDLLDRLGDLKDFLVQHLKGALEDVATAAGHITDWISDSKQHFDDVKQWWKDWGGYIEGAAGAITLFFLPAMAKAGTESVIQSGKIGANFILSIINSGKESVIAAGKIWGNMISFVASMAKAGYEAVVQGGKIAVSFIANLIGAGDKAQENAGKIDTFSAAEQAAGTNAETSEGQIAGMAGAEQAVGTQAETAEGQVAALGGAVQTAGTQAQTATGQEDGLAAAEQTVGTNAGTAEGEVAALGNASQTAGQQATGAIGGGSKGSGGVTGAFGVIGLALGISWLYDQEQSAADGFADWSKPYVLGAIDKVKNSIGDLLVNMGILDQKTENFVNTWGNGPGGGKGGGGGGGGGKRAMGGPVFAGQAYLVGEREPELFIPDRSGSILNGQQVQALANAINGLGSMRGGGDMVNFYGPTSEQLLKEVRLHQQRRASYYGR